MISYHPAPATLKVGVDSETGEVFLHLTASDGSSVHVGAHCIPNSKTSVQWIADQLAATKKAPAPAKAKA